MGGDSTLGGPWYRSGGQPRGLVAAGRSPMRGGEGGLKWIAWPGLVRGLHRRGLCLMAALGMNKGDPVGPHRALGELR